MNMIKKIACTASILLFVLAQVFSFYVIYTSHTEKIELIREKEGKAFEEAVHRFSIAVTNLNRKTEVRDYMVTHCFRENMMRDSALYKGEQELFNSSSYDFDVTKTDWDRNEYPVPFTAEQPGGRHVLIFYTEYTRGDTYYLYHISDITSVYSKSFSLIVRQLLVSSLASLGMAVLLTHLIKKITKPLWAVNEAQRQLIGSMSHELKTPLTAIKGYSETLLAVKLSKEQQEKALRYIHGESGRLSRLSEKMMELTRLYEPECKIDLTEVSVEALFDAVEKSVKHSLCEKNMTLVKEGAYQGETKRMDMDLMASFLINLINNSILASAEGSQIYMGADADSLWVRDEGCGILPEELEKVRKAFYRVDPSRSRKSGNMGLGLALCDQIAAAHQGKLELESEVGVGTKAVLFF